MKYLAERGADLQAKDANGRTPLDLAKGIGVPGVRQAAAEPFPETVALLESLPIPADPSFARTPVTLPFSVRISVTSRERISKFGTPARNSCILWA